MLIIFHLQANHVDLVVHTDKTHAQSEAGKAMGNARGNMTATPKQSAVALERLRLVTQGEGPVGGPRTALQPTVPEALGKSPISRALLLKFVTQKIRDGSFFKFIRKH